MKHKYALLYGSICGALSLLCGLLFGVSIVIVLFRMILFFALATVMSYLLLIYISNIFPKWLKKDERSMILRNFGKVFRKKNSNSNNTEASDEISSSLGRNFDVILNDENEETTVSNDDNNTDNDNSGFESFEGGIQGKHQQKYQKDVYNGDDMVNNFSKEPIRDAINREEEYVNDVLLVKREIDKNRRRLEANPKKFAGAISSLLKS